MDGTTLAVVIVGTILATWFGYVAWELDRDSTHYKK